MAETAAIAWQTVATGLRFPEGPVALPDGSVVLHLAPEPGDAPNHLYVMDGWNYTVRLYRPHPAVLDGTWAPPTPQPAS